MRFQILLSIVLISLFLTACADIDIPNFPEISVCKIVWAETLENTYCRCVSAQDPSKKESLPKEECNVSLRPGHYALLIEYAKKLETKLKKSQKKVFENVSNYN